MTEIQVSMSEESSPFAGFLRRVGARIIDVVIVLAIFFAVGASLWPDLVTKTTTITQSEGELFSTTEYTLTEIGSIILGIAIWAYTALQEASRTQATLGKRALKIKVTDLGGGRVSLLTATFRSWPLWLPLLVGFVGTLAPIAALAALAACIVVAFTKRKQGLHDMMAKCLVVQERAVFSSESGATGE